jgi:esterase/lipase
MKFFLKKIYYSIFSKNYNFTKTLINKYFLNKKKTFVAFSSIGGGTKYNGIFVRDTSRSWFNNIDIKLLKKNIEEKINFAIGYSMGGFNAIIFSSLFKVKRVIALSPQFSIHPEISGDKDFVNYAARIKNWKYPQLKFSNDTKYLLIFGDSDKEKYHASLMPKKKNIKIIYIKNSNHFSMIKIKRLKKFYKLLNNFIEMGGVKLT